MILTKFHIPLHDPAGPTPWSAPVLAFFPPLEPPFSRRAVRPPALPTAFTPKANS